MAWIFITLGIGFSALNWWCIFDSVYRGGSHSAAFPIPPSILTVLGLILLGNTWPWWLLGLLTDWTLIPFLYAVPMMMIWEWRLSRFTRIELLLAEEGRRRLQLSLHRNGVFAMHETDRDFGLSMCGNWEQLPNRRIRLFGFNGQQAYELEKTGLEWQCHESNPAQEGESSYVMDQLRFRPAVSESVRKG